MPIANWVARITEAGIVGYVAAIGVVAGVVLAVPLVAVSGLGVGRIDPRRSWRDRAMAPTSDLAVAVITASSPVIFIPRRCRHSSSVTGSQQICARWSSFRHS